MESDDKVICSVLTENSHISIAVDESEWILPQSLLVLWHIRGFDFQSDFDIQTKQGLLKFLGWLIVTYQEILEDFPYLDELIDYEALGNFLKVSVLMHEFLNLPAAFYFIYYYRTDLQGSFKIESPEGIVNYIKWIDEYGYNTLKDSKIFDAFQSKITLKDFRKHNLLVLQPGKAEIDSLDIRDAFDDNAYLMLNPDVRYEFELGLYSSGWHHWQLHGRYESRPIVWTFDINARVAVQLKS